MLKENKRRNVPEQDKKQHLATKLHKKKKQKIREEYEDEYQVEVLSESFWIGRDEY
ncbi:hypothetical protein [Paenibacillus xylaniclasticus]|uniref:hypothetical protein n=1 Tax=Paenibacillus xylaniclasticus TaxID=588083 RepID=UPI0013E08BD5|nr:MULTISPECIES: hypothetical protein [Paenibacillus]GFN32493.1 hypothetical protein PCURB6_27530 [Paenibacillus curdlanolyticus]